MATNKAASYGISFSEALKVDTLGPNQYQTNVSPDYCYGACKFPALIAQTSFVKLIQHPTC